MRRDPRAFLFDVCEAIAAIQTAVEGFSLIQYQESRLIRSAVERDSFSSEKHSSVSLGLHRSFSLVLKWRLR